MVCLERGRFINDKNHSSGLSSGSTLNMGGRPETTTDKSNHVKNCKTLELCAKTNLPIAGLVMQLTLQTHNVVWRDSRPQFWMLGHHDRCLLIIHTV